MRTPRFNLEPVRRVMKAIGELAVWGVLIGATDSLVKSTKVVGYGDVINAIVNSDLYSHQKQNAISIVNTHGTNEYYKAVIAILKSDMFTHQKVEAIKHLSE